LTSSNRFLTLRWVAHMALANEKLGPTHKQAPTFLPALGLTDGIHQRRLRAFKLAFAR
jgi:hypothetical protein